MFRVLGISGLLIWITIHFIVPLFTSDTSVSTATSGLTLESYPDPAIAMSYSEGESVGFFSFIGNFFSNIGAWFSDTFPFISRWVKCTFLTIWYIIKFIVYIPVFLWKFILFLPELPSHAWEFFKLYVVNAFVGWWSIKFIIAIATMPPTYIFVKTL